MKKTREELRQELQQKTEILIEELLVAILEREKQAVAANPHDGGA